MQPLRRSLLGWLSALEYKQTSGLWQVQGLFISASALLHAQGQHSSIQGVFPMHHTTQTGRVTKRCSNTSIQHSNAQKPAPAAMQRRQQHVRFQVEWFPASVQQQQQQHQHQQQKGAARYLQARISGNPSVQSWRRSMPPTSTEYSASWHGSYCGVSQCHCRCLSFLHQQQQQQQLQKRNLHSMPALCTANASANSSFSSKSEQEEEYEGLQVYLDGDLNHQEHIQPSQHDATATAAAAAAGVGDDDLQEAEEFDSEWVDGSVMMTHHTAEDDSESELEYDVEFDEAWEDEEDVDDLRDVEVNSEDDV